MSAPQNGKTFDEWLHSLKAVNVEWAPAHGAPYVSRDLVQAIVPMYIEQAAGEAVVRELERLREAIRRERQYTIGTDYTPVIEVDRVLALLEPEG